MNGDAKPPVNPESIHVQSGTVAEEAHNLNVDTEILARMTEEDVREAASVAAEAAETKAKTEQEAATNKAVALVSSQVLEAQRRNQINMLWEYTQAGLAGGIVLTFLILTIVIALDNPSEADTLIAGLGVFVGVVLGFYFGRTNHSRPTPANPQGDP